MVIIQVFALVLLCVLLVERFTLKRKIELLRATIEAADRVFFEMAKGQEKLTKRAVKNKPITKVKVKDATKKASPKVKVAEAKKVSKK